MKAFYKIKVLMGLKMSCRHGNGGAFTDRVIMRVKSLYIILAPSSFFNKAETSTPLLPLTEVKHATLSQAGVFIKHGVAIFYDADTAAGASVSLAASKAYLHMTLHAAIGRMRIRRILFSWNDVLLAWM